MSWEDILKKDYTTDVAYALIPIYGSKNRVYDSEILEFSQGSDGVMNEHDVQKLIIYLLQDIEKKNDDDYEGIMLAVDKLRKIIGD